MQGYWLWPQQQPDHKNPTLSRALQGPDMQLEALRVIMPNAPPNCEEDPLSGRGQGSSLRRLWIRGNHIPLIHQGQQGASSNTVWLHLSMQRVSMSSGIGEKVSKYHASGHFQDTSACLFIFL